MPDDLDAARRHVHERLDQALRAYGELVLGVAGGYVLLDEGTLAASGHLQPETGVDRTADGASVLVVYSTPYAARRHEEMDVTPSVPGRQPKWLERAVKETAGRFDAVIQAIAKGAP